MSERPTGEGQIVGGWAFFGLSLLLGLIAYFIDPQPFGSFDAAKAVLKASMGQLSGWLLGIAFLLLATGWIIRAISFLPGRHEPKLAEGAIVSEAEAVPTMPAPVRDLEAEALAEAQAWEEKRAADWQLMKIMAGIAVAVVIFVSALTFFTKQPSPDLNAIAEAQNAQNAEDANVAALDNAASALMRNEGAHQ
ncbi:MAG TPA: hypothetical protein VF503_01245 [Sphingobium sp.]|uniref:hypothetical protein n=1 Tax=Sphingobium sp. TaxID=1912891 RepID=UPI002ED0C818